MAAPDKTISTPQLSKAKGIAAGHSTPPHRTIKYPYDSTHAEQAMGGRRRAHKHAQLRAEKYTHAHKKHTVPAIFGQGNANALYRYPRCKRPTFQTGGQKYRTATKNTRHIPEYYRCNTMQHALKTHRTTHTKKMTTTNNKQNKKSTGEQVLENKTKGAPHRPPPHCSLPRHGYIALLNNQGKRENNTRIHTGCGRTYCIFQSTAMV